MTNDQIINLIGEYLNEDCLSLLVANDRKAVASWNSDIEAARLEGSHFEIPASCSKTGNPVLVKLEVE